MVSSTGLMMGLVGIYVLTAAVSLYEGNWARCFYWIGASIITGSVIWMQR